MMRPIVIVKCQSCGGQLKIAVPENAGVYNYPCTTCQGKVSVKFSQEKIDEIMEKQAPKPNVPEHPKPSNPEEPTVSPKPVPNKTLTIEGIQYNTFRSRGELVQVTGWYRKNKRYPLRNGHNIIGRAHSDLNFPKDQSMSRKSVDIEVVHNDEIGYVFRFLVMHATNPVLHNDIEMPEGTKIALNYGDRIKLGNTLFCFEKEKK